MMPSYGRTQEQHDNLQKLIDGLKSKPDNYGLLNMSRFAEDDRLAKTATPEHPCGTSMCVVGHGPSFGIPFIYEDLNDWMEYSLRAFGFVGLKWNFCFNSLWSMYCSSDINEAIARLEMAQRGDIPNWWNYDDTFTETILIQKGTVK